MQATVGQQVRPQSAGHATSQPAVIESAQTPKLGLAASLATVWREAWLTVVAHALPMLGFALIDLAGVSLIVTTKLDGTLHELLTAFELKWHWPMMAEVIVGLLALSFARGGISWLALHGEDATAGFVAASRAAFRRLPALLFGTLVYGAVITTGAVGLGLALPYARIDVPFSVQILYRYKHDALTYTFATNATQSLVAQSANTLILDPSAPFSVWLSELRATTLLRMAEVQPAQSDISSTRNAYRLVPIFTPNEYGFWWITAGSVALILIAEVLLCLRTVLVMSAGQPNLFTPLWHSLCLSIKHFGSIAFHIWLLRLCVFAFSILFIIVPIALMQELVLPKLMPAFLGSWPSAHPFTTQATVWCLALTSAILSTFSTAYDARLVRWTENQSPVNR